MADTVNLTCLNQIIIADLVCHQEKWRIDEVLIAKIIKCTMRWPHLGWPSPQKSECFRLKQKTLIEAGYIVFYPRTWECTYSWKKDGLFPIILVHGEMSLRSWAVQGHMSLDGVTSGGRPNWPSGWVNGCKQADPSPRRRVGGLPRPLTSCEHWARSCVWRTSCCAPRYFYPLPPV